MRKALLIILLSAACATDEHADNRRDASHWDDLAHRLATVTSDYCAAQPWAQASCADAVEHEAAARNSIETIRAMAARMDEHMGSLGYAAMTDGACTADGLLAELDRHAAAGCGGSADAEAEARRHCAAVLDATAQMHLRSAVALEAMTTTYYSGSGSMGMHPHRTSAGDHEWPWAAGEQPVMTTMCLTAP